MAKDIETMSSQELKNQILNNTDVEGDGMAPDSPGGYPDNIEEFEEESETPEEEEAEEEEAEEPDEESPVEYALRRQQEANEERLQQMSTNQRSAVYRLAKQQQEAKKAAFLSNLSLDLEELGERFGSDIVKVRFDDIRLGRGKALVTDQELETLPNPHEVDLKRWIDSPKGRRWVNENKSLKEVAKIIKMSNEPPLQCRSRDGYFGYKQK